LGFVGAYVPLGWPESVRPPGSEDFEASAAAWLLDVLPPEYRHYEVLRRHPAALAAMARYYADGCVEGARQGYRTCRQELGEMVPPHVVDGVLAAYRQEGFRLAATAKGIELVGRALRGETFAPRL
jgi:hypothetical protein